MKESVIIKYGGGLMEEKLHDVLVKISGIKNKKYRLKKEDFDILIQFFDSYYGGRAEDKKEYDVLNERMGDILKDNDGFVFNIIEGVRSYPSDKSKLTERLEKLLTYLDDTYGLKFDKNIFANFKITDRNIRLLNMLKFLHSGEKTRSEIAEYFGISERTVADDLAALQDGFTFLNTEMRINKLERGLNKYRSLIHPIFLAMNSAEIYSLTVGIKLLSKGTVFEESLGRIANAVYEQLSDSSKNMIDNHKDSIVNFDDDNMKFIDSYKYAQMMKTPFAYYLKEPILCNVQYTKNGKDFEATGILKIAVPSDGSNKYDKLILETERQTVVLEKNEVKRIERADKEVYFEDWI
jgi:DNA-binding Lrp family transcriptional regulator